MNPVFRTFAAAGLAGLMLGALAPAPGVLAAELVARAAQEAQVAKEAALNVRVTGAASSRGVVWIGVYDSARGFDAGEEVASANLPAAPDGVAHVFEGLAPGQYAVITFHDANADNDFNSNFLGIPVERYGFSNNPRPRFRGANWDEAVFEIGPDGAALDITLFGAGG